MLVLLKTIFILVVIFGVLVGIHEFGHFIVAKLCGVWVQEFAFGFGPKLFSKQYGETLYRINLIPLGGYVKLHGEKQLTLDKKFREEYDALGDVDKEEIKSFITKYELESVRADDKLIEKVDGIEGDETLKNWALGKVLTDPERNSDKTRFSNKNYFQKMSVVCAGVIMNFILGVFLYSIYLVWVGNLVILPKIVDFGFWNTETNLVDGKFIVHSYSPEASDYENNIILEYEGTFYTYLNGILVEVDGFDEAREDDNSYFTTLDADLANRMYVLEVVEGMPASGTYISEEDIVLSVNGVDVRDQEEFLFLLDSNAGNSVEIVTLDPENGLEISNIVLRGKDNPPLLGVNFTPNIAPQFEIYLLNYSNNRFSGFAHSVNIIGYQFKALGGIISEAFEQQDASLIADSVSGPIRIGAELRTLVEVNNFRDILNITALISLTLAVMNILPLPVVDGGFVVIFTIEKIIGRSLPDAFFKYYNFIGIVFIVLLTILVTIKDILQVFF